MLPKLNKQVDQDLEVLKVSIYEFEQQFESLAKMVKKLERLGFASHEIMGSINDF